jgi:hypothetical protein
VGDASTHCIATKVMHGISGSRSRDSPNGGAQFCGGNGELVFNTKPVKKCSVGQNGLEDVLDSGWWSSRMGIFRSIFLIDFDIRHVPPFAVRISSVLTL